MLSIAGSVRNSKNAAGGSQAAETHPLLHVDAPAGRHLRMISSLRLFKHVWTLAVSRGGTSRATFEL